MITPKTIKIIRLKLIKKGKDLKTENYETLLKKKEKGKDKWKYSPIYWIEKIHIVKLFILSKVIYKLHAILSRPH